MNKVLRMALPMALGLIGLWVLASCMMVQYGHCLMMPNMFPQLGGWEAVLDLVICVIVFMLLAVGWIIDEVQSDER